MVFNTQKHFKLYPQLFTKTWRSSISLLIASQILLASSASSVVLWPLHSSPSVEGYLKNVLYAEPSTSVPDNRSSQGRDVDWFTGDKTDSRFQMASKTTDLCRDDFQSSFCRGFLSEQEITRKITAAPSALYSACNSTLKTSRYDPTHEYPHADLKPLFSGLADIPILFSENCHSTTHSPSAFFIVASADTYLAAITEIAPPLSLLSHVPKSFTINSPVAAAHLALTTPTSYSYLLEATQSDLKPLSSGQNSPVFICDSSTLAAHAAVFGSATAALQARERHEVAGPSLSLLSHIPALITTGSAVANAIHSNDTLALQEADKLSENTWILPDAERETSYFFTSSKESDSCLIELSSSKNELKQYGNRLRAKSPKEFPKPLLIVPVDSPKNSTHQLCHCLAMADRLVTQPIEETVVTFPGDKLEEFAGVTAKSEKSFSRQLARMQKDRVSTSTSKPLQENQPLSHSLEVFHTLADHPYVADAASETDYSTLVSSAMESSESNTSPVEVVLALPGSSVKQREFAGVITEDEKKFMRQLSCLHQKASQPSTNTLEQKEIDSQKSIQTFHKLSDHLYTRQLPSTNYTEIVSSAFLKNQKLQSHLLREIPANTELAVVFPGKGSQPQDFAGVTLQSEKAFAHRLGNLQKEEISLLAVTDPSQISLSKNPLPTPGKNGAEAFKELSADSAKVPKPNYSAMVTKSAQSHKDLDRSEKLPSDVELIISFPGRKKEFAGVTLQDERAFIRCLSKLRREQISSLSSMDPSSLDMQKNHVIHIVKPHADSIQIFQQLASTQSYLVKPAVLEPNYSTLVSSAMDTQTKAAHVEPLIALEEAEAEQYIHATANALRAAGTPKVVKKPGKQENANRCSARPAPKTAPCTGRPKICCKKRESKKPGCKNIPTGLHTAPLRVGASPSQIRELKKQYRSPISNDSTSTPSYLVKPVALAEGIERAQGRIGASTERKKIPTIKDRVGTKERAGSSVHHNFPLTTIEQLTKVLSKGILALQTTCTNCLFDYAYGDDLVGYQPLTFVISDQEQEREASFTYEQEEDEWDVEETLQNRPGVELPASTMGARREGLLQSESASLNEESSQDPINSFTSFEITEERSKPNFQKKNHIRDIVSVPFYPNFSSKVEREESGEGSLPPLSRRDLKPSKIAAQETLFEEKTNESPPPSKKSPSSEEESSVIEEEAEPEGLLINYRDILMTEYVKFVSQLTNKNFVFNDEDLQFKITVISEQPTSIQNIMAALLQELRIHGLSVIEQNNNIIIHKSDKTRGPVQVLQEGQSATQSQLITRVFQLNSVQAEKMREIVTPVMSAQALIQVLPETNNLLITDFTDNVEKIADLIRALDVPTTSYDIGQYVGKNNFIENLIPLAEEIIRPFSEKQTIVFVPHLSTNSVFVVGIPILVKRTIGIFEHLDALEGSTKILTLDELTKGSQALHSFGEKAEEGPEYGEGKKAEEIRERLERESYTDHEQNAVDLLPAVKSPTLPPTVSATGAATEEHLLEQTKFYIHKLQYRQGDQLQDALTRIGDSLRLSEKASIDLINAINSIQWIESSNSLIITGTSDALGRVRELIEEVDLPMRQVFLEMLVLDTSITDSLTYAVDVTSNFKGTEVGAAQGFSGGQPSTGGSATPLIGAVQNASGSATASASALIDATSLAAVSTPGYNLGIIGRRILKGGSFFNTMGALVQAVHTDTNAEIVLNPKIIVEDNNEAEIFVGENIAFQTQNVVNNDGTIVSQNFEFRDVGTTLRVRPQIGNNNVITLEIEQEVSSTITTQSGGNTGGNSAASANISPGPSTATSRTITKVHVPNEFFVVISGMIKEEKKKTRSQIPCLGGIPIIGAAGSRMDNSGSKRNLMIFIRPQIIDTEWDFDDITNTQQNIHRDKSRVKPRWKYEADQGLEFMNLPRVNERCETGGWIPGYRDDEAPCCQ